MSFSAFRMKLLGTVLKKYKFLVKNKDSQLNVREVDFQRILIISNKLLGDFLFCTPAIRALKEKYPTAKIMLVLSKRNRGIIGDNPFIDNVVYMDNCISDVFKVLKNVRKFKPQVAIIFHSRTPYDLVLSVLSKCEYIIKHYFNNDVKKLFDLCDFHVLDTTKPPVINHLALVKELNCEIEGKKMFFPAEVSKRERRDNSFIIGIQLGASKPNRFLPIEMLQQFSLKVEKHIPTSEFHLFGAPSEIKLGTDFLSGLPSELTTKVRNFIGKTTLIDLADAIKNVDVLITPDTGTLHVATALGIRTVSLFVCKRENGCEPQQDHDLHTVLYASDFNDLAFDRTYPTPLQFIPCEILLNHILGVFGSINNAKTL